MISSDVVMHLFPKSFDFVFKDHPKSLRPEFHFLRSCKLPVPVPNTYLGTVFRRRRRRPRPGLEGRMMKYCGSMAYRAIQNRPGSKPVFRLILIVLFAAAASGAQWVPTSGPEGASTVAVAALGGNLLQATRFDGLYRSLDRGATWQQIPEVALNDEMTSLAAFGDRVFLGTYSYGVLQSPDSGLTWSADNDGLDNHRVQKLIVMEDRIFALTYGGLYSRRTAAEPWTRYRQ